VLLGSVLLGSPSSAQTDDQRAGARAAAGAGAQAFMDRKWAESVDMFTRAESMVHSPVHLLYLARAYEKLGTLVRSRESYIKITNEDLPSTASQPLRDAKADAERELAALEPRIPYVSVVVQGAGPKPVTVTMDGQQVPAALLGVPRPVDPGDHKFEATAEGMDSAVSSLSLREARSETVVLTLHAGVARAAPVPVPVAAPVPQAAAAPPPPPPVAPAAPPPGQPPPPQADSHGGTSPFAWVFLGVGAVGIGVGTVFALQASSKIDEANKLCGRTGPSGTSDWCASSVTSLDDDARSAKTIALVGFIAGGVGLATGVTLLAVGGSKHKDSASTTTVSPWVGLGSAGVRGRF
jgi:hypothetical protein